MVEQHRAIVESTPSPNYTNGWTTWEGHIRHWLQLVLSSHVQLQFCRALTLLIDIPNDKPEGWSQAQPPDLGFHEAMTSRLWAHAGPSCILNPISTVKPTVNFWLVSRRIQTLGLGVTVVVYRLKLNLYPNLYFFQWVRRSNPRTLLGYTTSNLG